MKIFKIVLATLTLGAIICLSLSCTGNNSPTSTTVTQKVTVTRGTISNSVVGTGNLALSIKKDLAFETAGTVDEILVETSESVKKGQELVRLDPTAREDQVKALQKTLDAAKDDLATKQAAVTKAERNVISAKMTLKQAEMDVRTAEENFSKITAVKEAQDAVNKAQYNIDIARMAMQAAAASGNAAEVDYWNKLLNENKAAPGYYVMMLNEAKKKLQEVKQGINVDSDVALQLSQYELQLEQKKAAVENAKIAIDDANTAVEDAKKRVADAEQAVIEAQKNIEKTQALSLVVTAPFDGFITKIYVQGGAEVKKGTNAVQIADPNQFEANILVSESDIFSIKEGGEATVELDALSGFSFPAKITAIAPLSAGGQGSQQGIVNYEVTATLTSLKPTIAGLSGSKIPTLGLFPSGFSQGAIPSNLPSGQRPTDMPSGSMPSSLPSGGAPTNMPTGERSMNLPEGFSFGGEIGANSPFAAMNKEYALKDGLSATVTVIIEQKENVLIVPSRAVTRQAGKSTVQVVQGETTVEREVKTGLSDSTSIEITEGLNEGEVVLVKSAGSSSSNMFRMGGGGMVQAVQVR